LSWSRAALAGVLYAVLMCGWVWYDRTPSFDELVIRFAVYFLAFTFGLRFLVNLLARRKG
jgi:hypothetical protein|tara:strand:+ start:559 stop:738 length:180 start_codon:yes stop_codon:yes gene_type:complete